MTSVADNQTASFIACGKAGYIWYLGVASEVQEETIKQALWRANQPGALEWFQHQCQLNISGEAGACLLDYLERGFLNQ